MPENSELFVEVFRSLFQEADGINENTQFRQLEEWSSMQALIVIAAIDEHFGVTLPEREFREAKTVGDLYRLTKKG
ncbi:MAG: acyl carrier protein [Flavobacteriales bacterium]|nr:acyl carrier protein [Flavobacteriales bacterium]MCB9185955.1 acyl carrier protein [Flavobacteriales bacterium]